MNNNKQSLIICLTLTALGLGNCKQDAPAVAQATTGQQQGALIDLKFDKRYQDSIYLPPPYSPRVEREREIKYQLDRLESYKEGKSNDTVRTKGYTYEERPVTEGRGDKLTDYPTRSALLADIYHHIDSLKALENIPLTAYPNL